jgi:hypothetical protein
MCRLGGPRCPSHTHADLDAALARQSEVDGLIAEREEAGRALTARLRTRKENVDKRVARLGSHYDSTPAGQAALSEAIEHADTPAERKALQGRLKAAQTLREQDLANARKNRKQLGKKAQNVGSGNEPGSGNAGGQGPRTVPKGAGAHAGNAPGAGGSDSGGMAGRGHSDGDRGRVVLGGKTIDTAGPIPRSARVDVLAARGLPAPDLYELGPEHAGEFREAISALAKGNPYASSVSVYPVEDYEGMRTFVTNDGKAGIALKGDEMVSLFIHPDSEYRGSAPALMAAGVAQGGRRLDCYDTVLPKIYAKAGFVPVARVSWDDDYAPDGWDYGTYARFNNGRPDVVLMAYSPDHLDSDYDRSQGERVAGYDEAEPLIQAQLAKLNEA